jgi:hypothetical protein
MIATTDPITAARAAALFVSDISATDRPTRAEAEEAIGRAIHAHGGIRGCVADMAANYGDYPELAAARMVWARSVAEGLRHHTVVSHVGRRAPRTLAPLAAAA